MKKRNFSTEFKRESAQLVIDQNYTVAYAAKNMDVGLSTIDVDQGVEIIEVGAMPPSLRLT